jgi:7-cyano-7-deazaguanine synthase in queuosine biosynthesis
MKSLRKTIILLSSGLDLITVSYYALSKRYIYKHLIFDHNQKHKKN